MPHPQIHPEKAIRRILGDGTELVDGGEGTARETRRRLEQMDLLSRRETGSVEFTGSKWDGSVRMLAQRLLEYGTSEGSDDATAAVIRLVPTGT